MVGPSVWQFNIGETQALVNFEELWSPGEMTQVASIALDHDWHDTHLSVQTLHTSIL